MVLVDSALVECVESVKLGRCFGAVHATNDDESNTCHDTDCVNLEGNYGLQRKEDRA